MKKIKEFLEDLCRCVLMGLALSAIISIVVGIICVFIYKGNIINIINGIKTVLICIGALGMILVAILILKRNKEKTMEHINEWKKKYKVFSYKGVMLIVTITILICGGIIDWFLCYKL